MKMKSKIRFASVLLVILLFNVLFIHTNCREQLNNNNNEKLPGFIISEDLFENLSKDSQDKLIMLKEQMKDGMDPSFESVIDIFPKMKYPSTIVGVKEHMGKYIVTWDGSIICMPLHISFKVGKSLSQFGKENENKINHFLIDKYLPVVVTSYEHDGFIYEQTVLSYSKDFSTETRQVAYIKMKVKNLSGTTKETKISICINQVIDQQEVPYKNKLTLLDNKIFDENDNCIFWAGQSDAILESSNLYYDINLKEAEEREFFFYFPHLPIPDKDSEVFSYPIFSDALENTKIFWEGIIARGMEVDVPEEIVCNAYKTWLINNFLLAEEDKSRNYFEVHDAPFFGYENVFGFAASMYMNTLTTRGYFEEAKKCANLFIKLQKPNGAFSGKGDIIPHQNGSIIYTMSQLYRVSGERDWFKTVIPQIIEACDWVIEERIKNKVMINGKRPVTYGLLPKFRYCVDNVGNSTEDQEYLGNAWCWAGLKQASLALEEYGGEYLNESIRLKQEAEEYRNDIFISMEKARIKESDVTFLPMVVTNTNPFKSLQESTLSLYYNILAPRMLESEIFDINDEKIKWIPNFIEKRDGLVLGMTRWRPFGEFDPHFSAGYAITNLRLDEIEKFLLTFYGLITYGMSRETYSTNEHWSILTGTSHYYKLEGTHWASRFQPHLHSNSEMIRLLNKMLIKEEKNELWIAYGIPRKWLEDGKKISVEKAQTYFGPIGFCIESDVSEGKIKTELTASYKMAPSFVRLKLRHPENKKIKKVELNGKRWKEFEGEVINIYPSENKTSIVAYY